MTDQDTDWVVAIDAASGTVTATIPVAGGPEYTAVTWTAARCSLALFARSR